jgi:hypothetical protein
VKSKLNQKCYSEGDENHSRNIADTEQHSNGPPICSMCVTLNLGGSDFVATTLCRYEFFFCVMIQLSFKNLNKIIKKSDHLDQMLLKVY